MTDNGLCLIGDIPGFTPQIARLVSMMNDARSVTLQAVAGLGEDELERKAAVGRARSERPSRE